MGKLKQQAALRVEELYRSYGVALLKEDPVWYVHQYKDPHDREIVGLLSALLAFGQVKSIHASVKKVLDILGASPYQTILSFDPKAILKPSLTGHRWVRKEDLFLLFSILRRVLEKNGSLKNLFLKGYSAREDHIEKALNHFVGVLLKEEKESLKRRGFRFLLSSPRDGSPCKRLNMFLRWMVRPADGIDLGLWPEVSPSKLIIPLDTHIHQFAKKYRLSRYKNPNWKMACDVTRFLKTIDPKDPVKYDFAVCHYGMDVGW